MVPIGMDLLGSLRSPDMLAPAIIPVTAGKNIAKTFQNPASSKFPIKIVCSTGSEGERKNEISETSIMTIIRY